MFNIVLVEPEIPQNTGNIVRTAAATGCKVHLVRPLGFDISDRALKRAGLDYWYDADISYYDNFSQLQEKYPDGKFYYFTTKADRVYSDQQFEDNCFLVFGKETRGLPEPLIEKNYSCALRVPMIGNTRSLNLSNTVALAVYEALRQHNFEDLNIHGHLTGRKD